METQIVKTWLEIMEEKGLILGHGQPSSPYKMVKEYVFGKKAAELVPGGGICTVCLFKAPGKRAIASFENDTFEVFSYAVDEFFSYARDYAGRRREAEWQMR